MPRLNVRFDPNQNAFLTGIARLASAYKGLLLERFIEPKSSGSKSNWREELLAVSRLPSNYELYRKAFSRWEHAAAQAGLLTIRAETSARLALGLGNENVMENGCRLHHTYGVPVIPGSSLKGALRAGLAALPKYQEHENALFGSSDCAGAIEVFDGCWDPNHRTVSGLTLDVVTVHHQDYYSGKSAPVESESPVPVHFPTIQGRFLITFRVNGDASWADFLRSLVHHVFERKGIGAKKSSGYRRLKPV